MTPAELRSMAFGRSQREQNRQTPSRRPDHATTWPQDDMVTGSAGAGRGRFLGAGLLALSMGLSVGLIGGRHHVVAAWSPTAKLYAAAGLPVNLRGLEILNLRSVIDLDEGRKVLTVEGELANITGVDLSLPELRLSVWSQKKESYSWTTAAPRSELKAGERIAFRTRLASPPDDAGDLLVVFVKSADSKALVRLSWLSPTIQ